MKKCEIEKFQNPEKIPEKKTQQLECLGWEFWDFWVKVLVIFGLGLAICPKNWVGMYKHTQNSSSCQLN